MFSTKNKNLWISCLHRFTEFGGAVPYRPAEDMAFSVARFIQKGGSFINYYMVSMFLNFSLFPFILHAWLKCFYFLLSLFQYHGGTNFGRTAGGPFIATSYDYDAPLDEFGMYFNSGNWKVLFTVRAAHAVVILLHQLAANIFYISLNLKVG